MNEKNLFLKLKAGDTSALEHIYIANRSKCIRYARRKLFRKPKEGSLIYCSEEEAIELYHESILVIVENVREGRLSELKAAFSTYIFSTMRNKWFAHIRRKETVPIVFDMPIVDQEEDTSIQYAVREALNRMDEKCREMLTLRYFMDWEYEDIASTLRYKKGNVVRNVISRCRSKFRTMLKVNHS